MAKGVLVDITRCIGCRGCQVACKEWNERKTVKTEMQGVFTNPLKLSSECYTNVSFKESESKKGPMWSFVKNQCMHCKDPACVSVCPVAALVKTKDGPVVYNPEACIGCRYCMVACPFHIPKYEWERVSPSVQKCTFCAERINGKMLPACTKACPTSALLFGELDKMEAEAKRRITAKPDKYINHIYGLEEAGGTSWLYISNVPFADLGFDTEVPRLHLPDRTWNYILGVPAMLGVVAVAGIGGWVITRRNQLQGKEDAK